MDPKLLETDSECSYPIKAKTSKRIEIYTISHLEYVKNNIFLFNILFFRIDYTSKSIIYLIIKVNNMTCKIKNISFENPNFLNTISVNKNVYGLNNIIKIKTV